MATEQEAPVPPAAASVCSDPGPLSATSATTDQSDLSNSTNRSRNHSRRSSQSSSMTDLPASAYDGSHLHWKAFRQHVLAPHRIRVLETLPKARLPESFLTVVEEQSKNVDRFAEQKACFREQVSEGRGFGPSPLFPPNLLPTIEDQPQLARCMVPAFHREALPERALNHSAPLYELSVPRPGLGCGFSSFAFTNEETTILPSYLVGTGTSVDFSTGYISPSHAVYCPFLVFERAFGQKEHRLEAANNQCAIGGAYNCRALQMLYSAAYKTEKISSMPVSFSCTVDNDFAIVNFHWIDHEQAYHMAPICKFDLRQDQHFSHFAAWIEAVGCWAMAHVLPRVKEALAKLRAGETPSPGFVDMKAAKKLTLMTPANKNDMLIQSLKTTFDNIPWSFEDDEFTPVSSSTASWGSPMVDDMIISNLAYPSVPKVKGVQLGADETPSTPRPSLADIRMAGTHSPPIRGTATPPPPAYTYNPDLVSHRRLDHAMDEIRDLHSQLDSVKGLNTDFRKEITGLRNTLGTILRKESATVRTRSLLSRRVSSPDMMPSSPTDTEGPMQGLTFQRPALQPLLNPLRKIRRPEMLQIRTDVPPAGPSNLRLSSLPGTSPPPAPARPGAPTLTLSCNGVEVVLSPKEVRPAPKTPKTPSFDSHKSPLSARAPWAPRTPLTANRLTCLPLTPAIVPQQVPWYLRWYAKSSPQTQVLVRWATTILSGYVLVALVPYKLLTCVVVGCAADYAFRNIASANGGSLGVRAITQQSAPKSKGS